MDFQLQDKIRGSLVGGAVGDALGYPVEFIYSYLNIQNRYGENGITRLDTSHWWLKGDERIDLGNKAWISDDTQMTLFTACGLLNAKAQGKAPKYAICYAYIEWLYTQIGLKSRRSSDCWISGIPELNKRRAPGNTCMSALNDILAGKDPNNSSKGCGGIMRTAPVALYGVGWMEKAAEEVPERRIPNIKDVDMLAADAAEITHQHPLGWLPSALEAHIIYRLIENGNPTVDDFKAYMIEGYQALEELYPEQKMHIAVLRQLTDKALSLVDSPSSDVENIENVGEGWTGDEALAIAVYCTARYFGDFEKAMIASVNHKGDSDSTGAITGNLLGAAVGYDAIPQHFKDDLELEPVIRHIADDLWRGETTKYVPEMRNVNKE